MITSPNPAVTVDALATFGGKRMNSFVNPKKRSIELPKGAKDLIDVLRKCEYCDAPAVATMGWTRRGVSGYGSRVL